MTPHSLVTMTVKAGLALGLVAGLCLAPARVWAQNTTPPAVTAPVAPEEGEGPGALPPATTELPALTPPPTMQPLSQEDELHLNTIGAFSAGFVLQSYGYIGVLADVLSKDVYPPELVSSMLGETIKYLKNLNLQLAKYQTADIAAGDKKFIAQIQEIVGLLQGEAEALSAFAKTRDKADLERFESARKNAWAKIRKTLGMN